MPYTKKDLKKFSRIIDKCENIGNMERVFGRLEWVKFSKKFTETELDEMAKKLGLTKRRTNF